jgi:hypothetical protein
MGQLSPRQEKKRQMVRYGYTGVAGGVGLLLIALLASSLLIGVIGVVVLVVAIWIVRQIRDL